MHQRMLLNEHGFTLVELLVVISIIAVLTAIAVPIFLNQRKSAYDTALRSDLKNTAAVIAGENIVPENFRAMFGTNAAFVAGDAAEHSLSADRNWNTRTGMPPISVSNTSVVEITIAATVTPSSWITIHETGEFCLAGSSQRSHYDYLPGSGNVSKYTNYLYYDAKLGGIVTFDEIAQAYQEGTPLSCVGYAHKHLTSV